MANRDRSQKASFVYTNIYQLYKKAKEETETQVVPGSDSRVWRADQLNGVKITKFEPRNLKSSQNAGAAGPVPVSTPGLARSGNPFEDLKANVGRLQELHTQLRFMLKELEELVGQGNK